MVELGLMNKHIPLRDFSTAAKRRGFLEKELKIKLPDEINKFTFPEDLVVDRNIHKLDYS